MNLIEAVKSGKPFRRNNLHPWITENHDCKFTKADILATDWEIQEPSVTITRSQFDEAWGYCDSCFGRRTCSEREQLAKELGL